MNIQDVLRSYQAQAARTANPDAPVEYYKIGLLGELGELLNVYKKHQWHSKETSCDVYVDELGDVLWYAVMYAHELGSVSFDSTLRLTEKWIISLSDKVVAKGIRSYMGMLASEVWTGRSEYKDPEYLANLIAACDICCQYLGVTLESVLDLNIKKLQKRFPNGFVTHENRGDNVGVDE